MYLLSRILISLSMISISLAAACNSGADDSSGGQVQARYSLSQRKFNCDAYHEETEAIVWDERLSDGEKLQVFRNLHEKCPKQASVEESRAQIRNVIERLECPELEDFRKRINEHLEKPSAMDNETIFFSSVYGSAEVFLEHVQWIGEKKGCFIPGHIDPVKIDGRSIRSIARK